MKISEIRSFVEKQKGKKEQLEEDLEKISDELDDAESDLIAYEKARTIIQAVSAATQEKLQFHISDITSLALEGVFPDPYSLKVEFQVRRNKTECDIFFERDSKRIEPLEASGVGAVDIASLALRIASWSMMRPRTRPTIILDEPFKHLSEEYQESASEMIKELSRKLGLQFIIVSHKPILTTYADRVFSVKIRRRKSKVTAE